MNDFRGQSSALRKVHLEIPFLANLLALFLCELRFGAQLGIANILACMLRGGADFDRHGWFLKSKDEGLDRIQKSA
jgi:hypothetical protein